MPTPKKGPRLGGSPAHQKLIVSNLATALFEHGRITTTEARARVLRPVAEKLITKAKKAHLGENSLHNRREVLKTIRDKSVVHTLFTEIGPRFAERPGGYTRITKLGPRKGDNAPMAVIELVTEAYEPKQARPKAGKTSEKSPAKKAARVAEAEDTTGETSGETIEETAVDEVPTELTEEASPAVSVVAEEQPEAEPAETELEPAPGSDDPAADAAVEDAPGEAQAEAAVEETDSDKA